MTRLTIAELEAALSKRCSACATAYLLRIRDDPTYLAVLWRLYDMPGMLYEDDVEHALYQINLARFRTDGGGDKSDP